MTDHRIPQGLIYTHDDLTLYCAGLPRFKRNFSRDSFYSGLLLNDAAILRDQIIYSSQLQGTMQDSFSGEEPGKIHHEMPGAERDGISSMYNACDTTALYLLAQSRYQELTGDKGLIESYTSNIRAAVAYIQEHLQDGLFLEDPACCGAESYYLKVSYWKDSVLLDRADGLPVYPVMFTLAHIQNLAGIRAAAKLLPGEGYEAMADILQASLQQLIDPETGLFYLAQDQLGVVRGDSSDSLHALYFLEIEDLTSEQAALIEFASRSLITPAGYRTLAASEASRMENPYHSRTVWPFEQAVIHAGAVKFGLQEAQEVSARVMSYMESDHEILELDGDTITPGGCNPQLWTIAAKTYFRRHR